MCLPLTNPDLCGNIVADYIGQKPRGEYKMEIVLFLIVYVIVRLTTGQVGYNVNTGWIPSSNRSFFRGRFK